MDQPKLERLLRLMKMLTANSRFTVEEIADRLGMSVRTIYRYIDTFREAGFVIKKNGSCVRIDKSSPYFKDISQLVHFTEEEAYILKSAIESIDETNLLKQTLKKKLYAVYDFKILADTVTPGGMPRMSTNSLRPSVKRSRSSFTNTARPTATPSANGWWKHSLLPPTTYRCGATM
jgi:predicted DNA-binding transcriptional regulator YafY